MSSGYDDFTIRKFEAEAKVKIPVADAPDRFAKRHDYILKNLRQEWIDFRCRQMAETKRAWLRPSRHKSQSGFLRRQLLALPGVHVRLRSGFDVSKAQEDRHRSRAYKPADRFYYGYYFNEMDTCHEYDMCWLPRPQRQNLRSMNLDASTAPWIEENPQVGAWVGRQFLESIPQSDPKRPWYYKDSFSCCRYPLPSGRAELEDFALILSRCTPKFICHSWCDGIEPEGSSEEIREFASAYRLIPLGTYQTVFKESQRGICVRRLVQSGEDTVFYVVNTADGKRTLCIEATGALRELTNSSAKSVKSANGYEVPLDAYALKVFKITQGGRIHFVSKSN